MSFYLLPVIAPLALLAGAAFAFSRPGVRPPFVSTLLQGSALVGLCAAAASAIWLFLADADSARILGPEGFALSLRLDVVSATMLLLVAFIGAIVLRFSATYLDGEERQGVFMGWLVATLAAVELLVIAGDLVTLALGWILTASIASCSSTRPASARGARRARSSSWPAPATRCSYRHSA